MKKNIRILMNDDDADQIPLNEHELRRKGISFTSMRVSTKDEFIRALEEFKPDVVLTDYELPTFDGMSALRLVQERNPLIPVIIVTGSIDEESAADTIKAGAADYVLKQRLVKLAPAIEVALERANIIKEKQLAEIKLHEAYKQIEESSEKLTKASAAMEDAKVYAESIVSAVRHPLIILDEELRVVSANEAFYRSAAVSEDMIVKKCVSELGDRQWITEGLLNLLREVVSKNIEFTDYGVEDDFPVIGHKIVKLSGRKITQESGRRSLILISIEDATIRVQAEESLKRHEYEFRTLVENSPDIIARYDQQFRHLYINPAIEQITGIPRNDFIGKANRELGMAEETSSFLEKILQSTFQTGREITAEYSLPGPYGKRFFLVRAVPEYFTKEGVPESVMAISRDITSRKAAEEHVKYVSFHDRLTGLYNRLYFEEELNRLDKGRELPISLIMGDVNYLKLANDMLGHQAGDELLIRISNVLKSVSRDGDVIARWGGDEFTLLLPKTDCDAARTIAERITKACSEAHDTILPQSAALGVATKISEDENIYRVLRDAEEIMYKNKMLESKNNIKRMMTAILNKIADKDVTMREHIQRMKDKVTHIGKAMELTDEQTKELVALASFHDMGKIATPGSVLTKKGKLSVEEWNTIKKIPEVGYRIAKSLSEFATTAESVLSLRERYDGKGYPKGLKGKEIPYLARVFSIIDAYEVMTHERSYGRTLTPEEATEELKLNADRQFDRELVETLIKTMSTNQPLQSGNPSVVSLI